MLQNGTQAKSIYMRWGPGGGGGGGGGWTHNHVILSLLRFLWIKIDL